MRVMRLYVRYVLLIVIACWCGRTRVTARSYTHFYDAPFLFMENCGQVTTASGGDLQPDILFTAHHGSTTIYLRTTGIDYQFIKRNTAAPGREASCASHRISLSLDGANPHPIIRKEQRSNYTEHCYLAHCPQGITGIPAYGRIVLADVYPGIDWVIYSQPKNHTETHGLEYDFVVHPGADPSKIKLRIKYADAVRITAAGGLLLKTALGEITEHAPVSWCDGKQVTTHFAQQKNGIISFAIGKYDHRKTLAIDPSVTWATYYGDTGDDVINACTTDDSGNVYIAGSTSSAAGIAAGGYQNNTAGAEEAFLVKLNSAGVRIWATYYGGINDDFGKACATDKAGHIYLAGTTSSATSGIASGGFQNAYGMGATDAFLAQFSSAGIRNWGTYYGGTNSEDGRACATDAAGNVYLAGTTASFTGIASGGFQNLYGGGSSDAFLVKFNAAGSRRWATYYGGTNEETGAACSVSSSGDVYLAGTTGSANNIASGGFQTTFGTGSNDAFLVKLDSTGARQWSTYYGSSLTTTGAACAVDSGGHIYLAGTTTAASGIASGGAQNAYSGGDDAFLVQFSNSGARNWATYLGSGGDDYGTSCATDRSGNVYVGGYTNTTSGLASGGAQNTYGGGAYDAFLAQYSVAGAQRWTTYYGGNNEDRGTSCTADRQGNIYLAGYTGSASGIAVNGFQPFFGGGNQDGFLVKMAAGYQAGIANTTGREPENVSVFPNPATGRFTIHAKLDAQDIGRPVLVTLINVAGQQVFQTVLRPASTTFSATISPDASIASGLYQVRLSGAGTQQTTTIIIRR